MPRGNPVVWSDAHIDWIVANQYGISRKDLLIKMREAFDDVDPSISTDNIKSLMQRLGLKNGITGRIKPGTTPWNKGKTGYMGPNVTSFQKGMLAHNKRAIGAERRCAKDGYILIKVSNTGQRWQHKHKVLWERHNGPTPEGHCIRFIDGDKNNITIDNLICVSRSVHATLNHHLKPDTADANLNKAIILTEVLRQKAGSVNANERK